MKIETIIYKRVKNLGNYQTETLEVIATIDSEDDPIQVAQDLKGFVLSQLYPEEVPRINEEKPAGPDNNPF